MAIRTRAQRTGSAAEDFVRALIDRHPNWLARNQDRDFGVDLEAELADSVGEDQKLAGKFIKVQVKGSQALRAQNGRIAVSLDRVYLDYIQQFRLPVVLVVADVVAEEAWFLWLQEWLLENEVRLSRGRTTATITVHVPTRQRLTDGLDGRLQRIARGEETTAKVLALRELAFAAANTGDTVIFDAVLDLLDTIDAGNRIWAVQKTIDALVGLGPNVGFWRTHQFIPQLLAMIDRLGDSVTQEQVVCLVARGESYSRTGLYGLSRLYDRWPGNARTLDLPAAFRAIELEEVAWYCDFREHYPKLSSVDLWGAVGNRKLSEMQFGKLTLSDHEDVGHKIWTKWPNRGDSIFLDYLVWIDPYASTASKNDSN